MIQVLALTFANLCNAILIQAVFETRLKDMAMAVPLMCCAADMLSVPSRKQVVLVGRKPSLEFEGMLASAHAAYDPNKTVSSSFLIQVPHISTLFLCSSYSFGATNVSGYSH